MYGVWHTACPTVMIHMIPASSVHPPSNCLLSLDWAFFNGIQSEYVCRTGIAVRDCCFCPFYLCGMLLLYKLLFVYYLFKLLIPWAWKSKPDCLLKVVNKKQALVEIYDMSVCLFAIEIMMFMFFICSLMP